MEKSIYDQFHETAEKFPRNLCIRFENKTLNYRQFDSRVRQTARKLLALGIQPKDVVSVSIPNCIEAAELFYAISYIGAISYNIHPLTPPETLKRFMDRAHSKYLFCLWNTGFKNRDYFPQDYTIVGINPYIHINSLKSSYFRAVGRKRNGLLRYHKLAKMKDKDLAPYHPDENDDAIYLNTGGTNGEPKIVRISSKSINYLGSVSYQLIGGPYENIKLFAAIPLFHIFGLGMGLVTPLSFGGSTVLMLKFNTKEAIHYIKKGQTNTLLGVPAIYNALLSKRQFYGDFLKKQLIAYVGGDAISQTLLDNWNTTMQIFGSEARLYQGYGSTEGMVCMVNTSFKRSRKGSIGKPQPGEMVKIMAQDGKELPLGESGEIWISGPMTMNGYLNDEEGTKKVLTEDEKGRVWLHSGDYGYMDEDGFVYFRQRLKRVVKINGETLCPADVENSILEMPEIYSAYCYGVANERKGQVFRVAAVTRKGKDQVSDEEAKRLIFAKIKSSLLPAYMPDKVIIMKELPRTPVGKINAKFFEDHPDPEEN